MFKKALVGLLLNGVALYGVTYLIEEVTYTGGVKFFIIGGALMGVLNVLVKPLLKILTFPLIFLTGGVFLVVINVILLGVTKYVIDVAAFQDVSFMIKGAGGYLMAGLVFGLINWAQHIVVKNR